MGRRTSVNTMMHQRVANAFKQFFNAHVTPLLTLHMSLPEVANTFYRNDAQLVLDANEKFNMVKSYVRATSRETSFHVDPTAWLTHDAKTGMLQGSAIKIGFTGPYLFPDTAHASLSDFGVLEQLTELARTTEMASRMYAIGKHILHHASLRTLTDEELSASVRFIALLASDASTREYFNDFSLRTVPPEKGKWNEIDLPWRRLSLEVYNYMTGVSLLHHDDRDKEKPVSVFIRRETFANVYLPEVGPPDEDHIRKDKYLMREAF